MSSKQSLKQGEKILFGIAAAFIIVAVIAYVLMEVVRHNMDEPMFEQRTHFTLSDEGQQGSVVFRKSGCTSCHRAMRNGTNMGLSLDGVGSARSLEWIYNFLRAPEQTFGTDTLDHGAAPKEAAYVAILPENDLHAIAVFISELKSEQGSASAPMPPDGRSEFIDNMLKDFAPPGWKDKYQDVRDTETYQMQEDRQ
jgi:cytochrome c553